MSKENRLTAHVERFRESDKIKHFWVCFLLQSFFLLWLSIGVSACITLLIGIVKECWDKYYGTGFCWYDMAANVLGVGASALLFVIAQAQLGLLT